MSLGLLWQVRDKELAVASYRVNHLLGLVGRSQIFSKDDVVSRAFGDDLRFVTFCRLKIFVGDIPRVCHPFSKWCFLKLHSLQRNAAGIS